MNPTWILMLPLLFGPWIVLEAATEKKEAKR